MRHRRSRNRDSGNRIPHSRVDTRELTPGTMSADASSPPTSRLNPTRRSREACRDVRARPRCVSQAWERDAREEIYHVNTLRLLETFWQDVRFGARLLRLNPPFTVAALLSLSLGVGANTAILQLIDAVRLRPLPVEDPQRLVEVRLVEMRGRSGPFHRTAADADQRDLGTGPRPPAGICWHGCVGWRCVRSPRRRSVAICRGAFRQRRVFRNARRLARGRASPGAGRRCEGLQRVPGRDQPRACPA